MKTAKDYRKDYNDIIEKTESLKNKVGKRLYLLAQKYPDVIVSKAGDMPIKAKKIANSYYISTIDLSAQIDCIERIEKHIEDACPVKQLEINWNNI